MSNESFFIFRSSELFLKPDNALPVSLPSSLAASVIDSLDLEIEGRTVHAVLLGDAESRSSVVSASVSGPASRADSQPTDPEVSEGFWIRLRALTGSENPELAKLSASASRALGLLNWHHSNRFCGRCGQKLEDHEVELARRCPSCSHVSFPRISPAIIVLVRKEGKILLARHSARNQDVYSCLAGFLEHGESLEECVAREVREETGIEIKNITYAGSQSWPYPDQHMVAFYADWASGEIRVDPAEILEAKWFDPASLPNTPTRGTVAWNLIYGIFGTSSKK